MYSPLDDMLYDFTVIQRGNAAIVYGAFQSGLYFSFDSGKKWEKALISLGELAGLACLKVSYFGNSHHIILAAMTGYIVQMWDFNTHWDVFALNDPLPFITEIVFDIDYPISGRAYAASLEDGVYVTNNFGRSWVPWNIGLIDHHVLCLAIDNLSSVYGGTTTGLVRSDNFGKCWEDVSIPVESLTVYSIGMGRNEIFLGTEEWGVFCSRDQGHSWNLFFDEVKGQSVVSLVSSGERLLVCTERELFLIDEKKRVKKLNFKVPEDTLLIKGIAPLGLYDASPLYVGLANGSIHTLMID